jgi:hypothetical protein
MIRFAILSRPAAGASQSTERDRALEEAARIADGIADNPPATPPARHDDWQHGVQDGGMEVAAAIRARRAVPHHPQGRNERT